MTLSIITINKNNVVGLEKTIQSVVCQTSNDFEFIVIDGASDDGSVDIIEKYVDKINYWISEPDTGIYNAMNKGIRKAQGEYCLFLNSGDWLISPETLDNVFREINGKTSDIFYSDRVNCDNTITLYPHDLTIDFLVRSTISHQNSLIKRSLFFHHGLYNEQLKIASDWEFFLGEFWKYKSSFCYIVTNISFFDIHGIGSKYSPEKSAEGIIVCKNIFQELANIIIEYRGFRKTMYYYLFAYFGDSKLLAYPLIIYRKIFNLTKRIISIIF